MGGAVSIPTRYIGVYCPQCTFALCDFQEWASSSYVRGIGFLGFELGWGNLGCIFRSSIISKVTCLPFERYIRGRWLRASSDALCGIRLYIRETKSCSWVVTYSFLAVEQITVVNHIDAYLSIVGRKSGWFAVIRKVTEWDLENGSVGASLWWARILYVVKPMDLKKPKSFFFFFFFNKCYWSSTGNRTLDSGSWGGVQIVDSSQWKEKNMTSIFMFLLQFIWACCGHMLLPLFGNPVPCPANLTHPSNLLLIPCVRAPLCDNILEAPYASPSHVL